MFSVYVTYSTLFKIPFYAIAAVFTKRPCDTAQVSQQVAPPGCDAGGATVFPHRVEDPPHQTKTPLRV